MQYNIKCIYIYCKHKNQHFYFIYEVDKLNILNLIHIHNILLNIIIVTFFYFINKINIIKKKKVTMFSHDYHK